MFFVPVQRKGFKYGKYLCEDNIKNETTCSYNIRRKQT